MEMMYALSVHALPAPIDNHIRVQSSQCSRLPIDLCHHMQRLHFGCLEVQTASIAWRGGGGGGEGEGEREGGRMALRKTEDI